MDTIALGQHPVHLDDIDNRLEGVFTGVEWECSHWVEYGYISFA